MFKRSLLAAALACTFPLPALAASDADLAAEVAKIRAEFDQKLKDMQTAYEARLKEMEGRMAQAAAAPAAAEALPAASAKAGAARGNEFNPELSLVLAGSYAQREPGERHITGFIAGGHDHGGSRGFSLDHTEMTLAANIDPTLRGYANIAFADGEAEVEEAWFQTLALGNGLAIRGGRFLSGIGYANEQHPHAWDFADNSLMYSALFGEHLAQDGLQVKWLAPTDTFLEFGAEIGRGGNFPGSDDGGNRNGAGAWSLFAHVGDDIGASSSWRAGISYLSAKPENRSSIVDDLNDIEAETLFSGTSKTWLADFVWKWAPDGNPKARNFKFQTEYFRRNERGDMTCLDPDATTVDLCNGNPADAYRARQSGWYAQGIYQFMPRWRVGLRYDRLDSGNVDFGINNAALPVADYHPNKWSLMADYSPSEFSRFRLQLARDRSMQGSPDDSQITLQYVHSLGAHGAHKF
jgi:hypothetical protein